MNKNAYFKLMGLTKLAKDINYQGAKNWLGLPVLDRNQADSYNAAADSHQRYAKQTKSKELAKQYEKNRDYYRGKAKAAPNEFKNQLRKKQLEAEKIKQEYEDPFSWAGLLFKSK